MNQIFNCSRFAAYFRKYAVENRNKLIISYGLIILIAIAFCIVYPYINRTYSVPYSQYTLLKSYHIDPMWNTEVAVFNFVWVIFAMVYGSVMYEILKDKTSRISLFTCPASAFEKFLTYFSVNIVVMTIVYFGAFFLADAIRVWIYSGHQDEGLTVGYMPFRYFITLGNLNSIVNPEKMDTVDVCFGVSFLVASVIFLQAFYALGSSVWPKNSWIKTTCFQLVFNGALTAICLIGVKAFLPKAPYIEPRFEFMRQLGVSESTFLIWFDIIVIVIIVLTWLLSYARFKEWEVIKRW